MKPNHVFAAFANFALVIVFLLIVISPFFLAKNITKVAGVKTETPYLITSQIQKFPNVSFSQEGETYRFTYSKASLNQEYRGLLVLTNPTSESKEYKISRLSGYADVYFGEDSKTAASQIFLPAGSSVPISLFSGSLDQTLTVEFKINLK